jgi:hypothetical protein
MTSKRISLRYALAVIEPDIFVASQGSDRHKISQATN